MRLSLMALFTGAVSGAGVAVVVGWIGSLSRLLWGDPVLEGLDRGLPLGWSLLICGSCGACEIDVNGKTVRACISTVPASKSAKLAVEFATDPHW